MGCQIELSIISYFFFTSEFVYLSLLLFLLFLFLFLLVGLGAGRWEFWIGLWGPRWVP